MISEFASGMFCLVPFRPQALFIIEEFNYRTRTFTHLYESKLTNSKHQRQLIEAQHTTFTNIFIIFCVHMCVSCQCLDIWDMHARIVYNLGGTVFNKIVKNQ